MRWTPMWSKTQRPPPSPLALAGLLALLALPACTSAPLARDEVRMVLPVGSPKLGYLAFQDLACNVCHRVEGYPELAAEEQVAEAPILVPGSPRFDAGRWASAIVAPDHDVSWTPPVPERRRLEPSAMPVYYDWMTVGELMDLVAFLERAPSRDRAEGWQEASSGRR